MSEHDHDGSELSALVDLTQSEGWRLVLGYLRAEWGPEGYGRKMQAELSKVAAGPDRAYEIARLAEQIDATSEAVNLIASWPDERVKQLREPSKSRAPFAALRRIGGR